MIGHDIERAQGAEQTTGGRGDWTKEKYDRPDMTDAEFEAYAEKVRAETAARQGHL